MKRILRGLAMSACLMTASAHAATPCSCKDLPVLVSELTEQEFLQRLFSKWSGYMPREIVTTGDLVDRATQQFNDAFYGDQGSAAAGTSHGGHAAMGTDLDSSTCPIVLYHYDKKGKQVKNPDGTPKTTPVTEETYKTTQCESLVKYTFAHERAHQATCLALVASGRSKMWKSPEFFAGDDAKAYQAGIDVLREETKSLAGKCGWDNSTQNRLPNLDEAKDLAKRASKARPARRRK
jgi:hypothetical protein